MWNYSAATNGFYNSDDIAAYEKTGTWPADAVEISDELYAAVATNRPADKLVVPGDGGLPTLVDFQPLSPRDLTLQQIAALERTVTPRRVREAVLGLDGGWLATINTQIVALRATL